MLRINCSSLSAFILISLVTNSLTNSLRRVSFTGRHEFQKFRIYFLTYELEGTFTITLYTRFAERSVSESLKSGLACALDTVITRARKKVFITIVWKVVNFNTVRAKNMGQYGILLGLDICISLN